MDRSPNRPTRWTLVVPELARQPTLGDSCCALPAAEVLVEALSSLPGVAGVTYDEPTSALRLDLDDGADDVLAQAKALLRQLAYPATEVHAR